MPFTGKATYSAGAALPELCEDVADIVSVISPHETPLLDHLGDAQRAAHSILHEWLEDSLLPNGDSINDTTFTDPAADTTFVVDHADRFRAGDQVQAAGSREVMLVTDANPATQTLTVIRGYGGTTSAGLADNQALRILGNAALEGADRPAVRYANRVRRGNYTQIFTAAVEVSGSQLAARKIAVGDEIDYQKSERLRELLRDLEHCVLNGVAPAAAPEGSGSVRRTMKGILAFLSSTVFVPGQNGFPAGDSVEGNSGHLNEAQVNAALRAIWEQSAGRIDTLVVGGYQKRRLNGFNAAGLRYRPEDERFRALINVYESDFGVCRVLLCRAMPADAVLLLDSSRVAVMPLAGRSFHFKRLAATGDSESGQVLGEYTLEVRNEGAHGLIRGLRTG